MVTRIFGGAMEHVVRGLAFAGRRHEVITGNVANVETPGYAARDVVFDDVLRPLVQAEAFEPGPPLKPVGPDERRPRVVYSADGPRRANGNDVSLDRQMSRLAENTLFHSTLTQILAGQFAALKQAISGRV
jgi:flagellar basal-body rod protein FlgB